MAYGDFSDIYTDVMNRLGKKVTLTAELVKVKRLINQGLRDWAIQRPWSVLQRRAELRVFADYSTGTVTTTQGSTTWTGSSTTWNTNSAFGEVNVDATFKMKINGDREIYEVDTVASDTSLTMVSKYVNSAASAAGYTAWQDEYALASDFDRPVDVRQLFIDTTLIPIGLREFRRKYTGSTTGGKPRVYTLTRISSGSQRIMFWPYPDSARILPYDYITTNLAQSSSGTDQADLSADDDVALIPEKYRHMLIHYAVGQWYRDYKDDARFRDAMELYTDLVRRMAADVEPTDDLPRLAPNRSKYMYGRSPNAATMDLGAWFDRGTFD